MYDTVKLIHIVSATLLFGTGLGSAYYKWMAYRSGNPVILAATARAVVIADSVFTAPSIVIQLLTGVYLVQKNNLPWTHPWVLLVLALFAFVGVCWLPVVVLQIQLRNMTAELNELSNALRKRMRNWLLLGSMAFPAVLVLYALMVYKPYWG